MTYNPHTPTMNGAGNYELLECCMTFFKSLFRGVACS